MEASDYTHTQETVQLYWVCVDYRKVIQHKQRDSFPLPRIDDSVLNLNRPQWYTSVGIVAFFQNWMKKAIAAFSTFTAFSTHEGLYQFTRTLQGFATSPAVFSRFMQNALSKLAFAVCLLYLDDASIYSPNFQVISNTSLWYYTGSELLI